MNLFEELGLSKPIVEAIGALGFEVPTPIQAKAIPALLQGDRDFVGLAQTGTGKTAAYGLPLLEMIDSKEAKPQALVLSPTRELGLQIADDLRTFSSNLWKLNVVNVYGGASIEDQIRKLRRGAQVIVATPGRLLDLLRRGVVDLRALQYVILDEADEMLNMGFKEDIDDILSQTPEDKQTWLFSATMPNEVRRISHNYMTNPVEVSVGSVNTTNQNIDHQYYLMRASDRYEVLKRIVDFYPDIFGIIFCRTRKETQEVAELLMKDGYNADALHGELTQTQRDRVMRNFKNHSLQLLVATDVAARGIDVDDLTHVIHYNLPDELEFYTHRSGRTARAGKKGISIALITGREEGKIRTLNKKLKTQFEKKSIPKGKEVCQRQLVNLMSRINSMDINEQEIEDFLPTIAEQLKDLTAEEIIKRMVWMEFQRFWDYYRDAQDLNSPASSRRDNRKDDSSDCRVFINIGKNDGIDVPRLLTLIHRHCGIKGSSIGRIDMKGVFSFFDVERKSMDSVIKGFAGVQVGGRNVRVEQAGEERSGGRNWKGRGGKSDRKTPWRGGESGSKRPRPSRGRRRP